MTNIRKHGNTRKHRFAPYLFILPYVLCYGIFQLFPTLSNFGIALTDWQGVNPVKFIGLDNFIRIFTDTRVRIALQNTFIFIALIIPIEIIVATLLATFLSLPKMKLVKTFRLINFLPYLVTPVALGIIFTLFFQWNGGIVNNVLLSLGIIEKPIYWLGNPVTSRFVVVLVSVWKYTGYTAILLMAGMTNINPEILEAATVDGANEIQKFFRITIPLLKPVFAFVIVTTMIGCFQTFEEPLMLFTSSNSRTFVGGPESSCLTAIWLVYDTAFNNFAQFGYGSAISVVMFIVISVISFFVMKLLNRGTKE